MTIEPFFKLGPTESGNFRVQVLVEFRLGDELLQRAEIHATEEEGRADDLGRAVADAVFSAMKNWDESRTGLRPEGEVHVFVDESRSLTSRMASPTAGEGAARAHTLGIRLEAGVADAWIAFDLIVPAVPWHVEELYLRPGWEGQVRNPSREEFDRVTILEDETITDEFTRRTMTVPAPIDEGRMYSLVLVDSTGSHHHRCMARTSLNG